MERRAAHVSETSVRIDLSAKIVEITSVWRRRRESFERSSAWVHDARTLASTDIVVMVRPLVLLQLLIAARLFAHLRRRASDLPAVTVAHQNIRTCCQRHTRTTKLRNRGIVQCHVFCGTTGAYRSWLATSKTKLETAKCLSWKEARASCNPVAHCSSTCLLTQLTIERVASAIAESVQNRVLDSPSAAEPAVEDAHEESSALCIPCACAHRQACTRARRDVVGDKVTKPNHQVTRSLVHCFEMPNPWRAFMRWAVPNHTAGTRMSWAHFTVLRPLTALLMERTWTRFS